MDPDTIYINKEIVEDFNFNEQVSKVFDDMVSRSVPFYYDAQNLIVEFINKYVPKDTEIYDLGCATGNTLILLKKVLGNNNELFGVDCSEPMLKKAQEKVKAELGSLEGISFLKKDMCELQLTKSVGAFLLNLTLQFIRPIKREKLINSLFQNLVDGGIIILFEKLIDENSIFNRKYIDMYYDFKRKNNYSDMEISKKREELENVLIPFTEKEDFELLIKAGFKHISTLFKILNFSVIVAIK